MSEHNKHDSRPQWPSSTQQWPSPQPGPRPSGQSTADGRAPQFGGLALNTLVISRAIIILRLKKATAHARAAH
jgi:hypothetical protein